MEVISFFNFCGSPHKDVKIRVDEDIKCREEDV